jgi:hypothetical protein
MLQLGFGDCARTQWGWTRAGRQTADIGRADLEKEGRLLRRHKIGACNHVETEHKHGDAGHDNFTDLQLEGTTKHSFKGENQRKLMCD